MKTLPYRPTTTLLLLLATVGFGCDAEDDDPAQSLRALHEEITELAEDVEASDGDVSKDVEDLAGIAVELEHARDLATASAPSAGFQPLECHAAAVQLSIAKLAFFYVEHYTLENFQETGHLVHFNAHLLAIPAHDTAAAAAEFDSTVGLLGIVPQLGPTLDWSHHTLDHAQNVEDMLRSTRLSYTGSHAGLVRDQLQLGIDATHDAIDSLEACL